MHVEAKNQYSKETHVPEHAVDHSEESYFMTAPEKEDSNIKVLFDLPRSI